VKYTQLDVSDEASRKKFEEFLKKEHPDGIDMLVNNAGVALNGFGESKMTTPPLVHSLFWVKKLSAS